MNEDTFDLAEFRVIDCKTRNIVPWDKGAEFAALSYVWGSPQTYRIRDYLPSQRCRAVLPNRFPERVIEDALACASKLNIPYLWVDRYCIDQKPTTDAEHDAKRFLIQSMGKIYSAAKVTIINAAGNDASAGLPGVSDSLRVSSLGEMGIGSLNLVPVINASDNIRTSKWVKRGWTLQEGLLAHRRLVFTDTSVYFQCTQSHYIEGLSGEFHSHGARELEDPSDPRLSSRAFPYSFIGSPSSRFSLNGVCNAFTRRDLTWDGDALEACLGIFSRYWASSNINTTVCPFEGNPRLPLPCRCCGGSIITATNSPAITVQYRSGVPWHLLGAGLVGESRWTFFTAFDRRIVISSNRASPSGWPNVTKSKSSCLLLLTISTTLMKVGCINIGCRI